MDQEMILRLNSISEKEKRKIVLDQAKVHNWVIYFGSLKKKQKDGKNFHILTDNGILLQRTEYKDYQGRTKIEWSMVKKDTNERITGDYGTVISHFTEEYNKTHEVICL